MFEFFVDLCYFCVILIKRWTIDVTGAPGSLYANETYQLQVDFPEHYPMEAPQAPSHPHIWGFLVSDARVFRDTHFGIWGKPVYGGIETVGVAAILGSSFYVSVVKTNAQPGIFVPVCVPRKAMGWFVEELHGEVPYVFTVQLVSNKGLNKLITSSVLIYSLNNSDNNLCNIIKLKYLFFI